MKEKTNQEMEAAERQTGLLTAALRGAADAGGCWLNAEGRTLPRIYGKGQPMSAFNALMLGLHADSRGFSTAHYTSFTDANRRGESVLQGEKGVPFFWYRWESYVNRHNPQEIIGRQEYEGLTPERRSLYKGVRQREVRTLFNIEQTTLPLTDERGFRVLQERYGRSIERGNLKEEAKQLRSTVSRFAAQMRAYMMPIRRDTAGVAHYSTGKDAVFIPEQKLFGSYGEYVQELMRQVVSATGHQQRLAREGLVMEGGKAPSVEAVNYERLVTELASGVKMMELGLPARLSAESMGLTDYWVRELEENPEMMDAVESDVNNAIEVIRRAEQGEKVEYASLRNRALTAELCPGDGERGNHFIADAIREIPDAEKGLMVVVKSRDEGVAEVVMPAGARAVKNELPGFGKAAIGAALRGEGFARVRFYNKDGAAGYSPDDGWFEGRKVEVTRLHGDRLVAVSELNVREAVERADGTEFERVQMVRDDNNRWTLYLKAAGVAVYPDREDQNRFFSTMKQGDAQAVAAIRREMALKYHALVTANPSLEVKLFGEVPAGVDGTRIERVNVYKTKDGRYMCAARIADAEEVKPRELSAAQWQRLWVADDVNAYKRNLAAALFADVLRREPGVKCDFPNLGQYDELKAKHPDALILKRRGDNYESVGSDAERVAEVCGIETFERVRADTDESVRMTSFASNALDTYLPKLIRAGERIAICEAMEQRSKSAELSCFATRVKSEESSCYAASVKSQELRVKNEVDADDSERKCGMKM